MLNVSAPFVATQAAAITPSDATAVQFQAIYVGGAGNVRVDIFEPAGDDATSTVTFNAVPAGTILYGNFTKVYLTSTTATNMVGLR